MHTHASMNILYTNFHTSPGVGGHTAYITRLIKGLIPNHSISVAVPESSALYRLASQLDTVTTFPQNFPSKLSKLPAAIKTLRKILAENRFDIVHVNGTADHRMVMLALIGLKKRPYVVFTKHNDHSVVSWGSRIRARFGTDHTIAVCDYVAKNLENSPYVKTKISTILNGVDTTFFSNKADFACYDRCEQSWEGKIILGSHAGTAEYKGWIYLVRAFARLNPEQSNKFHIVLAGAKPPANLVDEVKQLNLDDRFSYVGHLEDVRPFLNVIDIGFVLSHRVETISFACREMMAMSKPVIVTCHAGLPENVTHGVDGWIIPPRDPVALAQLLQDFLDEKYDFSKIAQAARRRSELFFGHEKFVSLTENIYKNLVLGK